LSEQNTSYFSENNLFSDEGMAEVVDHLTNKNEALSSNISTIKTKTKTKNLFFLHCGARASPSHGVK
jgi:hypothetical protein